jgi:tetratricopeptide (TPR) repeat protein
LAGSAAMAGAALVTTPAQSASVRPAIGKPLQDAQRLAAQGKMAAALAAVNQAEAVSNKTPAESAIIAQMRNYIEAKSGSASSYEQMIASGHGNATVARNLIRAHYLAHQYSKVIADAETVRRFGAMDATTQALIAQAYYLSGDYAGTIRYLKGRTDMDSLKLIYGAAYKSGDTATIQATLEQLILATGDPQYWRGGIELAEHGHGLTDHQTLDLLRLRLLTGNMRANGGSGDDDYSLLSQIAIQLGFPGEAQAVMQKGMAANVVTGNRAQRLFGMAQSQAGSQSAKLTAMAAAANQAGKGDALVKLGETYWGYGRSQDALNAIQAGLKKGVDDRADAQIALGLVYLSLNQNDAAAKAFAAVPKGDANASTISHLFNIYARSGRAHASQQPAQGESSHRRH